ncbi:MAG: biotin--[acetyl-CoA-carboxylase] ligase [Flaviflexus sp.]|uniref:biotin--[acetyl-CoA-carboxylase] ligase n=1 Tax=Flaviflexus sp. TaxID=1969482 RepID=UPI003F8F2577
MLRTVESIDSTNAELARQWRAGEVRDGDALRALHQTSGRGRMGRSFVELTSEALLLSVIKTLPDTPPIRENAGWLTLATGLAMAEAVRPLAPEHVALKWPNDVLLDEKKLGGVLGELLDPEDNVLPVVLGCGINTTAQAEPAPGATSLALAGLDPSPETVNGIIDRFLAELDAHVEHVATDRIERLHEELSEVCLTPGRQVRVTTVTGGVTEGRAVEIDRQGALVVDTEAGIVRVSGSDANLI